MSLSGAIGIAPAQGVRRSLARLGDAANIWVDGAASLGVTRGSCLHAADGLVLAFDGVLWERDRLLRQLGLADAPDAVVVAEAYRRWGDRSPFQLHGTFAFAIWDVARRRLLLGRDTAGGRSLFYAQIGDGLVFASELSGLSAWPQIDTTIHEPVVAAGVCNLFPGDRERTVFEGIRRLPPAATLSFEDGRATTAIYWNPLDQPVWRGASTRDYAQAMRETLKTAIAQRLPPAAKIGTRLSSGWDSSTVTALTAQILAEQGRTLTAFTSVPATPVPPQRLAPLRRFADESGLAAQVAARYPNVEHVLVPNAGPPLADAMARLSLTNGFPGLFRGIVMIDALSREGQRRDIEIMLGGSAGNQTTSYAGTYGPWTLRREGRWLELLSALRTRRRRGAGAASLLRSVLSPLGRATRLRSRLRRSASPLETPAANAEFLDRCGIRPEAADPLVLLKGGPPPDGRALRALILTSADQGLAQSFSRRHFDSDYSDPTGDRRVVELCLSIPDEAFAPEGIPRGLARLAFENDLPATLLDEPMRGLQAADFCERFDDEIDWLGAELDRMKASPRIANYLDLDALQGMLDAWPGAAAATMSLDLRYSIRFGQAFAWGHLLLLLEQQGGRL